MPESCVNRCGPQKLPCGKILAHVTLLHYDRLESWFLFLVWEYADCTKIQAGGILANHRMIRGKMKGTVHLPDAVEVQPR